jgi:intracellular multiplication protein IcmX
MKTIGRLRLSSLILTTALSMPLHAQADDPYAQQTSTNTGDLTTYVLNLGAYLGYDLTQQPKPPISPLLSATLAQLMGTSSSQLPLFTLAFDTMLGSIPVNSFFMQFVPDNNTVYSPINGLANTSFPAFNSPSSQSSVSVTPLIDQQNYQQDPVSQAVLNILGTPDYPYCMNYDASAWTGGGSGTNAYPYPKCQYLYQYQVMNNVIGTLPSTYQFYTYQYNQQFLSQLNGNVLLAPLLYSTTSSSSSTSSNPPASSSSAGLSAQNQAQQALDFIRYATGSVAPISLPRLKDYDTLYTQATNTTNNVSATAQMQAQATLTSYLTKLRSFAAQSSVVYSNLYYIFAKRLPQNMGGSDTTPTSQALNEFTMATWRLYTPGGNANTQWLNQINQASTATVQKEMVTLLAEINYQLYLTRQQQERLLLTNTMLLLISTRGSQPIAPSLNSSTPTQ